MNQKKKKILAIGLMTLVLLLGAGAVLVTILLQKVQVPTAPTSRPQAAEWLGGASCNIAFVVAPAPTTVAPTTVAPTTIAPPMGALSSAVCNAGQTSGNLTYDIKSSNFSTTGFESTTFFLSFTYNTDTAKIRTFLGKSTWEPANWVPKDGDWFGYYIYRCLAPGCTPQAGEVNYTWSSTVKLGANQKTIDDLATWTQTNLPNFSYTIGANSKYTGLPQNDSIGSQQVNITPNACVAPTATETVTATETTTATQTATATETTTATQTATGTTTTAAGATTVAAGGTTTAAQTTTVAKATTTAKATNAALPSAGIVNLPGAAAFGGGLLLTILGILFAL